MDETVDTTAAEAALRMFAQAGWVADPADELCPPWWPRRTPFGRRRPLASEAHPDLRAADRVYVALTLLATTLQLHDEQLVREVRGVAVAHLLDGAEVLARGAPLPWQRGDEVCPPWTWGGNGSTNGGNGAPAPLVAPPIGPPSEPARAAQLLDVLVLLQLYCLAAKLPMTTARERATRAIGQVVLEQAFLVARAFT